MKKIVILCIVLFNTLYGKPAWCNNAKSKVEILICNSNELLEYESELVKLYRYIKNNINNEQKKILLKTQRKWLKNRNKICKNSACLKKSYINRIASLKDTYFKKNTTNSDIELRISNEGEKNFIEFGGYNTPLCKLQLKYNALKILNNCKKLINSKGVKIICNSNKSVCKTEKELFEFANKSSNVISTSIPSFKNLNELYKYNQKIEKDIATHKQNKYKYNNIITKVNIKHKKSIDILFESDRYYISYSKKDSSLKIWDKLTNRLLKTYRNLNNIDKIYQYNHNLYFWNLFSLYEISLKNLKIKKLLDNTRPIGDMYFLSNNLISGINSSLGAKYNSAIYLRIDLKNNKVYKSTVFECPWTNCHFSNFFFNLDENAFYIHVNDQYYKISKKHREKEIQKKEFQDNSYFTHFINDEFKIFTNATYYYIDIFKDNKISRTMNFDNNNTQSQNYINVINETDNTCILYKNKKIHCSVSSGGSGAYDSEFKKPIYTTNKGVTILPVFIGTYLGKSKYSDEKTGLYFYAIDKNGKLLRIINRKISLLYSDGKINEDMLHIYNNNNYIVHNNSIEVLDDLFKTKYILQDTLSESILYIKQNKTKITIFYEDGIVQVFDTNNLKVIYTKYNFSNNSFVILLPEGFFSGQGNFGEYIHFIDKNYKVYLINQFYDHFFRPDLVKLKLQGKEKEYQKAIKGMTYQEALKNPPPKIEFVDIDGKQVKKDGFEYSVVKTDKDRVKLSFNIKQNQNGGVGIIRVYQEGKLIQTIGKGKINKQSANIDAIVEQEELDKKAKQEQKEYLADATKAIDKNRTIDDTIYKIKDKTLQNKEGVYSIELELKSGNNEIALEAFNKTNTVTSFRESINIKANIPKQEPKLYAIVCGVNEFEHNNKKLKLKYSVNDAKAIKELLLKKSKKLYKDIEVKYLTEQNLTKKNLNKSIEDIKQKAKLEDTILFFISTHGRAYKGNLYLLPYNNKKGKDWLRFSELFNKLQSIKSLNQIYIVDACESGKANDIVSSVYDSRASILAKSAGVHILLATTKGTYAFESQDPNIKNSVFTAKILKALNNKKIDKNKDSIISIKELSKSLKEKLDTEHQYPVIRNVGKDIGLEKL